MAQSGSTESQTRGERIYDIIRGRIVTNRYPPGTTLREGELAEEFSISRSPVRRVFAKLEEARLLAIKHGVGAQVTEIRPEAFIAACEVRMLLAMHSGPFFVAPFPASAPAFFSECRDRFLATEEGDTIGFAEVNNTFFVGALTLIENQYLREIQIKLFYETARMWIVELPRLDWSETISAIAREIDDVIRDIVDDDRVGLGLTLRNSIHAAKSRFDGRNQTDGNPSSISPTMGALDHQFPPFSPSR